MLEFFHSLNALLMIGLPIALGALFVRRLKVEWRLFLVGAVTFLASQVLHIPFNAFVLAPLLAHFDLSVLQVGFPLVVTAVAAGLSAGVFEEGARYLTYRFWLRKERSWREGLMFGLGHGGAEAIIFGAIAAYGLIQAIALQGADLSSIVSPDQVTQAAAQLEAYWSMSWYASLLGAVERVFALTIQISLALLVMQAFTRKQVRWGVAAVLWHTLIDAVAVFAMPTWGAYITEGLMAVAAMISLVIILKLRSSLHEPRTPDSEPMTELPRSVSPAPLTEIKDITKEQIEDSRFM
jgi:uncharacterized membrane protein YhfC